VHKKRDWIDLRREYNRKFPESTFDIENSSNDEYENLYKELVQITLPHRKDEIKKAQDDAMDRFRTDFINVLYGNIETVVDQVKDLNRALKRGKFGDDSYEFKVLPNPDYLDYYTMIMDLGSQKDNNILSYMAQEKHRDVITDLFNQIACGDDEHFNSKKQTELELNIKRFTDYRTYLKFDLIVTNSNGSPIPLSKALGSESGGGNQTPFYIAMVAAFSQLYMVNESGERANTLRLVIFDEAFNKMD
jgi:uncharacterized protein YPO0396